MSISIIYLNKIVIQLLSVIIVYFIGITLVNAHAWEQAQQPSHSAAKVIGQVNNGCIAGAIPLPLQGEGYAVVHLERHRHYGHPNLINVLQNLARSVAEQKLGLLHIGDLSQARGGPLPFGHRSHQSGIDADIWFNLEFIADSEIDANRAHWPQNSMLTHDHLQLNSEWTNKQQQLLKLTANISEIERIFVNPLIKKDLCEMVGEDRQWLHKIRPWYFHDDHFHLRLKCPEESPDCEPQLAIPNGDGCGEELQSWLNPAKTVNPSRPIKAKPKLPAACENVWQAD
ncbi:MAG: hypothetical protein RL637_772 [Pseudomonadota bacterium]|jgi:penicillin-insensitive murein endopeptidase